MVFIDRPTYVLLNKGLATGKDLHDYFIADLRHIHHIKNLKASLSLIVDWGFMDGDVRLVTVKSNDNSMVTQHDKMLALYERGIIEPNTDYNCIKIGSILLFMIRKDSIQDYKNLVTDSVPAESIIKIKDKNIVNFFHWIFSYDHDALQCVYKLAEYFLGAAYDIISKKRPIDFKTDDVSDYLIDCLNGKQSSARDWYSETTIIIGDAVLEYGNLIEEYQKCLSKAQNKDELLQAIYIATNKALASANRELYLKNTAKRILYNKIADMFYKDIEKVEQHFEIYLIHIVDKVGSRISKMNSYFITDNSNTIISFLLLLLGWPSHIGLSICLTEAKRETGIARVQTTPVVRYAIDCDKNEASAQLSEIKLIYQPYKKFFYH